MGEVFAGRYELADPIGRGGVGAVWRAWDHRRRRYVAAKVLQQSDAHTLLRFVREQAMRIDHPHVLAPASWAADDDKVLFTMDLVGGGSLAHLIGDYGPLPPRFVCVLLDQLLAGLAAVHDEGVVHRDIKPANILLEATGSGRPHLRLSDFGIAMRKGEPRLTETDYVVGTPGYFAPEQMLGSEPDFPADLFAVGLVALYLLEGAKPDAKALIEHFAAHGTPRAPRGVPEPLWQVVANLLQPDPDARFRSAIGARKALAPVTELLPEPSIDEDEVVEVFDQLGPLPEGFGPDGPLRRRPTPKKPSAPPPSLPSAASPPSPPSLPSAASPPSLPSASSPRPPAHPPATPPSTGGFAASSPSPSSSSSAAGSSSTPSSPSSPSSVTDTGSFHLPPPAQPTPSAGHRDMVPSPPAHPPTTNTPTPTPTPQPHTNTAPLTPRTGPTRQYTAPHQFPTPQAHPATQGVHAQQPPHTQQSAPLPAHQSPDTVTGIRRTPPSRRKRKPGPPAKVAVPMLTMAALSFAVGIWGLLQLL
ncbi:serine/threonine protein kinase [Streptomyces sp. NA04227]|uniref:serine/threonine-protein kinase n=1 Tax=Streptomyces sp. NA04227 TaxID=2742136 RepID=UPI001590E687|nr:serine/threonine-protein kinase [Streptomyces sp. NA04227]QKW07772.1 serine/threonine protein kinase [Streptomyces sp. NA04227]